MPICSKEIISIRSLKKFIQIFSDLQSTENILVGVIQMY